MIRLVALLLAAASLPHSVGAQIPIGYFGPSDAEHPVGGTLWRGAQMAIEEVNQAGGYRRTPYKLVPAWDENPWSGGASVVVRLAYEENVWAIIGGIDGVSTHLAEQVVAKAQLALMDPASTDRSVNAAFVPWTFSLMPDDRTLMRTVGSELLAAAHNRDYVLVAATDHDSRVTSTELLRFLADNHSLPQRRFDFSPRSPGIPQVAAQAAATGAPALVLLAGIEDSAAMLRALREEGFEGLVYGGSVFGRQAFLELAGQAADGARFPLPAGATITDPKFAQKYSSRYGVAPDYAARYAYNAVRLAVEAIERAGLDRTQIRDALAEQSQSGDPSLLVEWDEIGRARGQVVLAEIVDGVARPR